MTGYQYRYAPNPVSYGAPRYRPSLAQYAATDPRLQGPSFIPATRTESRGLVESPMSDEMFALLINGENARKTRALRTAAEIKRAEDERNFLDSITADESSGIFDAPGSERDSRLQEILNRDYRARDRGAKLSMAGKAWNEEIARKMAPYYLDVAQFREGAKDREQRRALQQLQLEGLQDYRTQQLALRGQAQEGLQDYRGQRLAQGDEVLAARVAAQSAAREQRDRQMAEQARRNQSSEVRSRFNDAINAARRGASMEQLDAAFTSLFPSLTPDQQQLALATLASRASDSSSANIAADRYNQALASQMQAQAERGGSFDDAIAMIMTEANRDANARGRIIYDPAQRRFVPTPQFRSTAVPLLSPRQPAIQDDPMESELPSPIRSSSESVIDVPPAQRSRFQEGRAYMRNGVPYRYRNGQMVRQ